MFGRFHFMRPAPGWAAPTARMAWGCLCGCPGFWLTREEALTSLEEYKRTLEDEIKEVEKRIEEMKRGGD